MGAGSPSEMRVRSAPPPALEGGGWGLGLIHGRCQAVVPVGEAQGPEGAATAPRRFTIGGHGQATAVGGRSRPSESRPTDESRPEQRAASRM